MNFFALLNATTGLALIAPFAWFLVATPALAQSSCSSDGQPPPKAILERFINADCADCWRDPGTRKSKKGELAVDWIVSGNKGDEAPLGAAATRDALQRLQALRQAPPATTINFRAPAWLKTRPQNGADASLRVARGIALGGYLGASIELKLPGKWYAGRPILQYPLTAWLLLTEEIAPGVEGSPVARLLVRNSLVATWKTGQRHFESRPMSLPEGSNPDRLRVVGWVQDADGNVIARAASVCN